MALDTISAPNFQGVANLARVRDGNLNLASTSTGILGGLQQSNDTEKNNISRMAVEQQGQLGLLSNALDQQKVDQQGQLNQANIADAQQKNATAQQATNQQGAFQQGQLADTQQSTAQQGAYQQGQLANQQQQNATAQQSANQQGAFQQGQLLNDQQKTASDVQDRQFQQMMSMKKEDLMQRGAISSGMLVALQNAPTDDAAKQIAQIFTQKAVDKGIMTPDEATQVNQLSRQQQMAVASGDIVAGGNAIQLQDLQKANNVQNKMGTVTLPGGQVASPLTPGEKGQIQKDIITAKSGLDELNKMSTNVQPGWFGLSAYAGPLAAQTAELVSPSLTSDSQKQDVQNYNNFQAKATALTMSTARALIGGKVSNQELSTAQQIMPNVGPGTTLSSYQGKMNSLQQALTDSIAFKQTLLDKGLSLNTEDAKNMLLQHLQNSVAEQNKGQPPAGPGQPPSSQPGITPDERQHLIDLGHSVADVNKQFGPPTGGQQ